MTTPIEIDIESMSKEIGDCVLGLIADFHAHQKVCPACKAGGLANFAWEWIRESAPRLIVALATNDHDESADAVGAILPAASLLMAIRVASDREDKE